MVPTLTWVGTVFRGGVMSKDKSDEEYLAELLKEGTKNIQPYKNLLQIACSTKDLPAIEKLLKEGHDPNQFEAYGTFPLFIAAANGNGPLTDLLIKAGANVNLQTKDTGWTALMTAAYWQRVPIVYLLLRSGAQLSPKTFSGQTALDIAKSRGNRQIIAPILALQNIRNQNVKK